MTAKEILTEADITRPNLVQLNRKLDWLYSIEKQIADHMSRYGESDAAADEMTEQTELLLPREHKDIYIYYIVCMTDLANQDIAMYNNSCAYFNELFDSWQKKWRREHLPSPQKEVK